MREPSAGEPEGPAPRRKFQVSVETRFVATESDPAEPRYVFAYTITIANHGSEAAQLKNRYWLITDGDGNQKEVRGPGVVGNQPRIAPGEAFRYTSACVLETEVGVMQGHYEFQGADGDAFDVPIDAFTLAAPNVIVH